MSTNEAGLSGGQDEGDGGRTTASDMPGGERNMGAGDTSGIGQDRAAPAQVQGVESIADQTGGGRAGLVPDEATRGRQPSGGSGGTAGGQDMADGGHLGRAGDPAEGRTDPAATGEGPK